MIFLVSCASPATLQPTETTVIQPTLTTTLLPTETVIPTSTETLQPTAEESPAEGGFHPEIINQEATNEYVLDIINRLNFGKPYYVENSLNTDEDVDNFLAANNGYFPPSSKGNDLIFFGSTYENSFEKVRINMDEKLKVELFVEVVSLNDVNNPDKVIVGGKVHPWYIFMGQDAKPNEKSVSVTSGYKKFEGYNQLALQLVWKDGDYDLYGKKLEVPNIATSEMKDQANVLLISLNCW
jgi:hypothetical protein